MDNYYLYHLFFKRADTSLKHVVAHEICMIYPAICDSRPSRDAVQVLKTVRSIQRQLLTEDLVIQKADKGNCLVILKREDYIKKCYEFIHKSNLSLLEKDPTQKFQKAIRDAIRSSKELFQPKDKHFLLTKNPIPPRLYGLIKIHKPDAPIRPVVSSISAPAHKLAHTLTQLISQHSAFKSKRGIKKSLDLVDKIKDVVPPKNSRLVSFDIVNLFTCVPPEEATGLAIDLLGAAKIAEKTKDELSTLLKICVAQNYF